MGFFIAVNQRARLQGLQSPGKNGWLLMQCLQGLILQVCIVAAIREGERGGPASLLTGTDEAERTCT